MIEIDSKKYIIDSDEIIGDIKYIHEFYSIYLKNERDIIIWLPPSYHYSEKNYPVLYMQDGQNLFDPNTSFIGYDWKVDEVATGLIKEKLLNEIIIVGIYNSKDRIEEYNYFTLKGKRYANFLVKELKPFIDENFKTISKASKTGLMGSSMGGLISFQLFWNFPKIFGKAACLSNSFWVNEGEVFEMVDKINNIFNEKNKLYIDCGSEEKELLDDFNKMVSILENNKILNKETFYYHLEKGSRHNEKDWSNRIHIPLRFLFGK
ncbi:MAG: alpha/beta hydrolase [Ignavibacteriae bacterium]|nr:alpha/beta hydrolase [Ignavibacteriota bacterium]